MKKAFIFTTALFISGLTTAQECYPSSNVLDGIAHKELPGKESIAYAGGPMGSAHVRQANIMWSRRIWRALDLREKINQPLYYPLQPAQGRMSLFDAIKCGILNEGSITAYDPGPLGSDDEFTTPMSITEVTSLLSSSDTVYTENIETGEFEPVVVASQISSEDVKRYEIKEEWFFDRERSVMDVRIIGICPMTEVRDELTGDFRGYKPLFWIYFPEARRLFAKTPVYNAHNDAQKLSYDDLFWKRKFGSYIIKSSNVYDRNINQYKAGIDALLEAEDLKNDIAEFEYDLWQH